MEHIVTLCWATKKRHISIDGNVLCEPKYKTSGYSVKNHQYNSLSLAGIPTHFKVTDDTKYGHQDGIIEFLPLNRQKVKIEEKSICNKCLNRYSKLW